MSFQMQLILHGSIVVILLYACVESNANLPCCGSKFSVARDYLIANCTVFCTASNYKFCYRNQVILATMNVERKHMKYPYTYTAKMAQFPYKWHWDNFWLPRYLALGMVVTFPFFLFIHRKVNSPANKAIWAEKHKQERQYHFH